MRHESYLSKLAPSKVPVFQGLLTTRQCDSKRWDMKGPLLARVKKTCNKAKELLLPLATFYSAFSCKETTEVSIIYRIIDERDALWQEALPCDMNHKPPTLESSTTQALQALLANLLTLPSALCTWMGAFTHSSSHLLTWYVYSEYCASNRTKNKTITGV